MTRTDEEESNDDVKAYLDRYQHCHSTLMIVRAYHSDCDQVILGKKSSVLLKLRKKPHSD